MATKWLKVAAIGRRLLLSITNASSEFGSGNTSSSAEKGHFVAYTSEGKRFVVPLAYLDSDIFKVLLQMSEDEFGLPRDSPITLPCDAVCLEYVLSFLRRRMSREVERALLGSIFTPGQTACSLVGVECNQQVAVCSF